jgi:putative Mn2+ efflux pump MntP
MGIPTVTLIAVGLSMDCFAVSISSGFVIKNLRLNHALLIAFFFGFFQSLMPLTGWFAGLSVIHLISTLDHWVAFGLLSFIGGKMIFESFELDEEKKWMNQMKLSVLLLLSVATSIDALAVGFSFAVLKIHIIVPIIIIGIVAFLFSFAGVYIGDKFGHFFERKIEFAGGLILIGIGIKILIEHSGPLF